MRLETSSLVIERLHDTGELRPAESWHTGCYEGVELARTCIQSLRWVNGDVDRANSYESGSNHAMSLICDWDTVK